MAKRLDAGDHVFAESPHVQGEVEAGRLSADPSRARCGGRITLSSAADSAGVPVACCSAGEGLSGSASNDGLAARRRLRSWTPTNSRIARAPASPSRGLASRSTRV